MRKRSLKDFQLTARIGSGTVGQVHRAHDRRNYRTVALKILSESVSRDDLIRQRFHREIEVLQKLHHPNVIAYYEMGRDGEQLFYTMELVAGTSMKEVLAEHGRLNWKQAVECGWQVCSALQHVHNQGVIHRDLKPSNLYLSQDGVVKLADFGIALDTGEADITGHGMTVGTWLYMSPEQIRGERVTGATDLYALGCLLYEMITGRPPYEGTNFAQIFDQHLKANIPIAADACSECPAELSLLIVELLQKDAEQRPDNAREVQGRLADILMAHDGEAIVSALKQSYDDGSAAVRKLAAKDRLSKRSDVTWRRIIVTLLITAGAVVLLALLSNRD